MPHINISIGAVGDPPLFPELKERILCEAHVTHVGILEAGMESGKCSLALYVQMPLGIAEDPKVEPVYVFCQMSADMLLSIAGAVRGAVERFKG